MMNDDNDYDADEKSIGYFGTYSTVYCHTRQTRASVKKHHVWGLPKLKKKINRNDNNSEDLRLHRVVNVTETVIKISKTNLIVQYGWFTRRDSTFEKHSNAVVYTYTMLYRTMNPSITHTSNNVNEVVLQISTLVHNIVTMFSENRQEIRYVIRYEHNTHIHIRPY